MRKLLLKLLMRDGKTLTLRPSTVETATELFADATAAPDMAKVELTSENTEPGNMPANVRSSAA